jgi:SAM-dependent methyltransferase
MKNPLSKYLAEEDLLYSVDRRDRENFPEKYPHRDLWYKDDALMKWISIVRTFEYLVDTNDKKIVDLGTGDCPIPHYLADLGNEVIGVDIGDNYGFLNPLIKQSLVKMVLQDAWIFLEEQDSESVDIFIDSCAVTHFGSHGQAYSNQWHSCFARVHRVLKKNGYFIVSTDVNPDQTEGEYISPETIVQHAKNNSLSLVGNFNFEDNKTYIPARNPYPVAHFVFQK